MRRVGAMQFPLLDRLFRYHHAVEATDRENQALEFVGPGHVVERQNCPPCSRNSVAAAIEVASNSNRCSCAGATVHIFLRRSSYRNPDRPKLQMEA